MDSKEPINTTPNPREILRNESRRMMEIMVQRPDALFMRVKNMVPDRNEFDNLCRFIHSRFEGVTSNDRTEIAPLDNFHDIFKEMLHDKQYAPSDPIEHIDEKYGAVMVALRDMAQKD